MDILPRFSFIYYGDVEVLGKGLVDFHEGAVFFFLGWFLLEGFYDLIIVLLKLHPQENMPCQHSSIPHLDFTAKLTFEITELF